MSDFFDPQARNYFESARRRAKQTYQFGRQQNRYERDTARQGWEWNYGDARRKFGEARERLPGSFAQRGLLRSGLYRGSGGAVADFEARKAEQLQRMQQDWLTRKRGFSLATDQMRQAYYSAVADLNEQENARRQAVASSILVS